MPQGVVIQYVYISCDDGANGCFMLGLYLSALIAHSGYYIYIRSDRRQDAVSERTVHRLQGRMLERGLHLRRWKAVTISDSNNVYAWIVHLSGANKCVSLARAISRL
jgi:hypothetical protein